MSRPRIEYATATARTSTIVAKRAEPEIDSDWCALLPFYGETTDEALEHLARYLSELARQPECTASKRG